MDGEIGNPPQARWVMDGVRWMAAKSASRQVLSAVGVCARRVKAGQPRHLQKLTKCVP